MDFIDDVRAHSTRFAERTDHLDTEEATKNALVLPFIQMLGYAIFDPTEVVPEFTADVGTKKGEKVDYALMQDRKPAILIECKTYGSNLEEAEISQLLRYFSTTDARFGILTDGIVYRFFSDLDADNKMDQEPFFEFNMFDFSTAHAAELERFTKAVFNVDEIVDAARELKYTAKIKQVLAQELEHPSDEFVRFIVKRVYEGVATQKIREQFHSLVRRAFTHLINEQIPSDSPAPPPPAPERITPEPAPSLPNPQEWCPLSDFKPAMGDPKPIGIRFPDNSRRPLRYWKDIPVEVTRWLLENKSLPDGSFPIQRSGRYIVSTEPLHPNGSPFRQRTQVGSVYLELNYSAPNHVENACLVIKRAGQDLARFTVGFD